MSCGCGPHPQLHQHLSLPCTPSTDTHSRVRTSALHRAAACRPPSRRSSTPATTAPLFARLLGWSARSACTAPYCKRPTCTPASMPSTCRCVVEGPEESSPRWQLEQLASLATPGCRPAAPAVAAAFDTLLPTTSPSHQPRHANSASAPGASSSGGTGLTTPPARRASAASSPARSAAGPTRTLCTSASARPTGAARFRDGHVAFARTHARTNAQPAAVQSTPLTATQRHATPAMCVLLRRLLPMCGQAQTMSAMPLTAEQRRRRSLYVTPRRGQPAASSDQLAAASAATADNSQVCVC